MKTAYLFAGAAALALAACSSEETPTAEDTAADEASLAPAADAGVPAAQDFVDTAAASDLFEIEAGKLAQEMGTSQAVKDFGRMMAADHTKSSAELMAAAGAAEGVTVAPKLTPKQESDLAALRAAGDGFDALYKQQQVAAHEAALALLQGYAAGGDTASLKDFAGKTAPVVEGHLGHARELP